MRPPITIGGFLILEDYQLIMPFTLGKNERMKSRTDIQTLFGSGKSLFVHPVKIIYSLKEHTNPDQPNIKAGFAVSKRYFKRANKRNTTKRLLKEAYRLQRDAILSVPVNKELQIFIIFTHHQLPEFDFIHTKMKTALVKLNKLLVDRNEELL